jgi:hypothetical protein
MRVVLPVLAALFFAPTTLSLTPSDDVWVYEHASDPAKDAYLRVWGAGGKSVADDPSDTGQFSYGYLRWDLSAIPAGAKLKSARLIVCQIAEPAYSAEDAKANPLEARSLVGSFDEKNWAFSAAAKVFPKSGDDGLFGGGYPKIFSKDGRVVPISIDLLSGKGNFGGAFTAALKGSSKSLCMALTSHLDPSSGGMSSVYKVYSKDAETPTNRPVLELEIEE